MVGSELALVITIFPFPIKAKTWLPCFTETYALSCYVYKFNLKNVFYASVNEVSVNITI